MTAVFMDLASGNSHFVLKVWQNSLYSLTVACVHFDKFNESFFLLLFIIALFSVKKSDKMTAFLPGLRSAYFFNHN